MGIFDRDQASRIAIPDRIAAADALALAGDPRLGWLAPGRWVKIDAGKLPMASHDTAQELKVPAFRIARFPVTVFEYAAFVDDGG